MARRALFTALTAVALVAWDAGAQQLAWVDGPAGRLRVSDGGTGGTPIVFVHSLAGDHTQWNAQLAHVRRSRRAVALDLRGHGASDPSATGDYSLDALAADVAAAVDGLGLRRFVLVGHSLGGGVAAVYAGAHPDRVAGVVFADPIGDQRAVRQQLDMMIQMLDSDGYQQTIETYWQFILTNAAAGVPEPVMRALRATPRAAVIGSYEGIVTFDPAAALAAYPGPMISIVSDMNDFPFSLHNVVPGLESRRMGHTSHWLQMDKPAEFNQLLDEFLARVR